MSLKTKNNIEETRRFLGTVFELAEGSPVLITENEEILIEKALEESMLQNSPWSSTVATGIVEEVWGIPLVVSDTKAALLAEAGFNHSFEIVSDLGKPAIKVWLFSEALVNVSSLPSDISPECPLPGVGGWRMVAPRAIKRHNTKALLAAFKPTVKADPAVPGTRTYNVLMGTPAAFQDAMVYGKISQEILDKEIKFSFSNKGRETMPGKWKLFEGRFGEALTNLFTKHPEGSKDGFSFLQGNAIGGVRSKNAMERMEMLVLDLDTGESIESIKNRIAESGLFALIYTTHSHMKNETEINREKILKYFKIDGNPSIQQIKQYLQQVRSYQNEIVEKINVLNFALHDADGVKIVVKHAPMQKFRVMFLLKEPFVFVNRDSVHSKAIEEWAERYAGASKRIGAFFDQSCTDPSRLFYTPRHAKDSEFEIHIIAGELLDIEGITRVARKEWREEASVWEKAATSFGANSQEFKTDNILSFLAKYAQRFEFEDFIRSVDPDGDRGKRSSGDGSTWRCPNDGDHSNPGDEEDKGFFCINASESGNGFVAKCMHNGCFSIDRAGFLDMLCDQHGIKNALELKKEFVLDVEEEEEEKQDLEEVATKPEPPKAFKNAKEASTIVESVDKDTPKSEVSIIAKRLGMTSKINRIEKDELIKKLSRNSGTSSVTLRQEIKEVNVKDKKGNSDIDDDIATALSKYNDTYGVALIGGKSRIIRNPISSGALPVLMDVDSFRLMHAPDKVSILDSSTGTWKMHPMTKLWLEWEGRKGYPNGIVFEPNKNVPGAYNMWKGFPIKSRVGDWSLLQEHILNNICSGDTEYYDWLVTWMAQIIQQPEIKKGSAVVIKGLKGVGKSKLFEWLSYLMGPYSIKVSKKHHITGNFNAHQKGAILMVCEEAFWAGDTESGGVLKDLITSSTMMMEQKGFDPIMVSNYLRLAMISNEDWVTPASFDDERRFFVLECQPSRKGDIEFFKAIDNQMENGGAEGFLHYLETWVPPNELGWDILRSPPKTQWLAQQAEESLTPLGKFLLSCVEEGCLPEVPGRIDDIQFEMDKPNFIDTNSLKECVSYHLKGTSDAKYTINNRKSFRKILHEILFVEEGLKKVGPRGNQKNAYVMPSLNEIRERLKKRGISMDNISE